MAKQLAKYSYFLLVLTLPTQIGKHFWLAESLVLGRRIDYLSPTIYLTDIILILFVLSVFIDKHRHFLNKNIKTLFLSGFFIGVGILINEANLLSIYFIFKLGEILALVLAIKTYQPKVEQTTTPLCLSIIVTTLLAGYQFFLQRAIGGALYFLGERSFTINTPGIAQIPTPKGLLLRSYATFSHPNVLGGFLATSLPLVMRFKTSPDSKLMYFLKHLTLVLIFSGIFLSFSRSAWLIGVGLFYYYFFINKPVSKTQTKLMPNNKNKPLVVAVLLVLILIIEELVVGRFLSLFSQDQEAWLVRSRLVQAAWSMWNSSPIWGKGVGKFISLLPAYDQAPYVLQPVHSIYLLIAAESGLVGLTIFLSGLGWIVIQNLKTARYDLLLSLGAICVLGAIDHYFITLQQSQLLFALIVGLSLASSTKLL